jgi:DNA replication protein DnaC
MSGMNDERLLLKSYLKTLKLPTIQREYQTIARASANANEPYENYLQRLAEIEVQHRQSQAIARRLKQANFPMTKELSDFDFKSVPQINKKQIIDLSMCEFIDKRNNIVFTGPPGVGKSHLAIALGREACRRGYNVKFFTASELVNTYIESRQEKSILRLEGHIKRSDLVIVDELGYVPFDRIGAEHLFGFFSQCYEQTSLIVTTNLPFGEWPQIFGDDERLAGALLDRLTHHVHVVEVIAKSWRLNSSLAEIGKKLVE